MKRSDNKLQARHARAWAAFQAGRFEEARQLYSSICRKHRSDDNAWMMLGAIEGGLGRYVQAAEHLKRSILINDNNSDAHANYGLAMFNMGHADRAVSSCLRALEASPDHIPALLLLGNASARLDRLVQAEHAYRRLLELSPAHAAACGNLANVLAYQGRQEEAVEYYRKALRLAPGQPGVHSNLLLCLHYGEVMKPAEIFAEHLRWADRHCAGIRCYTEYGVVVDPHRKLRIGYVTPDLRGHSVAYFMEPLLRERNREKFEVCCYVEVREQDEMAKRLWAYVDGVHDTTRLSDAAVARMIHEHRIDILIDLAGHTENNRLPVFAYKPAPVQMTYLGYPDTTGLETVDYRITDAWADPPGMTERLHSEELVRLESGFLCFSPPEESPPVSALPALERDHVTFGSFNVQTKITPAMLDIWAAILREVPDAHLFIKNRQLTEHAMQQKLRTVMEARGVDAHRISMYGTTTKEQHMAAYNEVDIALDSYPYAGTTTTCDTLWMGIPVITMAGVTHVSRVGVSLLERVGLGELVCGNSGEYISRAVGLARDIGRLAEIRSGLRDRMQSSSLCAARSFVGDFEGMLHGTWRRWCESGGVTGES